MSDVGVVALGDAGGLGLDVVVGRGAVGWGLVEVEIGCYGTAGDVVVVLFGGNGRLRCG